MVVADEPVDIVFDGCHGLWVDAIAFEHFEDVTAFEFGLFWLCHVGWLLCVYCGHRLKFGYLFSNDRITSGIFSYHAGSENLNR